MSLYWLAKALAKEGVDVVVVTTTHGLENKYPVNEWSDVDGIKVQYCSSLYRLIRLAVKNLRDADIVHLTSICFLPSFIIALWAKFFTRKPIIWSPRGELAKEAISGNKIKQIMFNFYGWVFSKRIVFHGTSDKELEEINNYFPKAKTILFPNYIELPPRHRNMIEHYLVYLGRISPIKSLDKLFIALSLSKRFMDSDYVLKIAGRAVVDEAIEYEKRLKKLMTELGLVDKISFLGEVGGDEKYDLLSKAYCSFLVSKTENFGNVVIEAMSQGTPVITSLGTPWGVLREKGIGYYVDNDPNVLAPTIDEILSLSEQNYYELRERVSDFCSREYSIADNVSKLLDLYHSMI